MAEGLVQLRTRKETSGGQKVYIETYGCQMNVADSDMVRGLLDGRGFGAADKAAEADVVLINTCAVREKAEERVLARASELAALKKKRPGMVLGITGCMAEHLKDKLLEAAPYVDIVLGPDGYRRLPDILEGMVEGAGDPVVDVRLDRQETYEGLDTARGGDGVSGFVTIQRGCDKFCTFCVVPLTRGRERAVPPRDVLRQTRALAAAGYREVTLLGQTVSSYRHEEAGFAELLRTVATVEGIERIRFTSPYPADFGAEVVRAIAEEPKVCKHVHLPLQSGSDAVLARMRRGYDLDGFRRIAGELRAEVPGIALTTDILVGFCGETEEDHQATLAAMREIHFDAAFCFAYSERSGTQAARKIADDVADEVKKRRLAEVIALQEQLSAEANAAHVGRLERVLLHAPAKRSDNQLLGRTDGFKAVIVERAGRAPGQLVDVQIERATSATLFGKVIER